MKHLILLLLLFSLSACESENNNRGPDNSQVSSAVLKNYTGKRIALVIGNWKYKFKPLHNPENDARDMAQVLRNLGFEVIHKQNLSLDDMEDEIIQFKVKLQNKGQVGLFYYAGHGLEIKGKNYLLPTDMRNPETELIKNKSILAQWVISAMKGSGSLVNIMILDACRTFPRPDRNSINNADYGLAAMNAPSGSIISFATGSGQSTPDGEKGSNGLYTGHLLKFLQQPGLKIEEVFKKTRQQVALETNNEQVPPVYNSMVGDFCLVSCEKAKSDREKNLEARISQLEAALKNKPVPKPVIPKPQPPSNEPGKVFRDRLADGSSGPEMVWIPAGSFRMGDIQGGGYSDEQPVHRVSVDKFAMGKFEVTFAEYDKFAEADGREKPNDSGWGRGNRPVINVSWNDAEAYAKWLSDQTGKKYRLPTEAEWEYAARAGTETKYWWGNDIDKSKANYDYNIGKTTPVGNYKPNQFGLYDTVGNLWELTCSEYTEKYNNKEKQCVTNASRFVLRGGSWGNVPGLVRSAYRGRNEPSGRYEDYGFRLVRL
jgi:formylglycine-generating enzyme required for sulfatase activity